MDFVHIAILPPKPDCRLAIFQELRYNSISEHAPPNWGHARQISAGTEVSENGTIQDDRRRGDRLPDTPCL